MRGRGGQPQALSPEARVLAAAVCFAIAPVADARSRYNVAYQAKLSGTADLPDACDGRRAELFPQVVTHPGSPRRLTATYFQDGQKAAVSAFSRDAGRRWSRSPVSSATSCSGGPSEREQLVNPLLAGGPGGVTYYGNSWTGQRSGVFAYDIAVHRSTGFGDSWSVGRGPNAGTSPVLPGGPYAQNVGLVADGANRDVVYAVWAGFDQVPNPATYAPVANRIDSSFSVDGGRTFSAPVNVYTPPPDTYVINSRLYETSDGALLALFDTTPKAALVSNGPIELDVLASRSADGGRTWSIPVDAGDSIQFGFKNADGGDRSYGSAKFDAATGRGGRAVIAWATPRDGDGVGTIQIARSADDGTTWTPPEAAIRVRANLIQPAVALSPSGRIGLFWYDTRNDEPGDGELSADAWFASSARRGGSWQVRHLAGPFDLTASHDNSLAYDGDSGIGVYQDLVAMRRGFGAAYTVGAPLVDDGVTDVRFARITKARSSR